MQISLERCPLKEREGPCGQTVTLNEWLHTNIGATVIEKHTQ